MNGPFGCRRGFTLIELLVVILIIAILAGITLTAFSGVMKSAARSRAKTEIAGIGNALDNYKADNGSYPPSAGWADNNYAGDAPSPALGGGIYQLSSEALYQALTGQSHFGIPAPAGTKIYMVFKTSQLGNYTASTASNPIYIQDPFGYSYGYYAGTPTSANGSAGNGVNTPTVPLSGVNQYDLWSTGGDINGVTQGWISNWGLGQ
jgi:prepilin-type N-terminal cleavage/methylation domain-containing protein